jgi:thiol-disulfide isomerase/thioredoxin
LAGPHLLLPSGLDWLNVSRPLTPEDFGERVVILDFGTYGCINCIHVAGELRHVDERFGDSLVVIDVHSPKFDHERNLEALRSMVIRLDRHDPIINDPDWGLMTPYGAFAWPTRAVFGPEGSHIGNVSGEGNEARLTRAIRRILAEHGKAAPRRPLPIRVEGDRLAGSMPAAPGKIAFSADRSRVAISDTLHHRVLITDHNSKVLRIVGSGEPGLVEGPEQLLAGPARAVPPSPALRPTGSYSIVT